MRYSLYCSDPSGKVCVWPTLNPVLGSAIAEMSGTTRLPAALLAVASAFGTTPFWYAGSGTVLLVPPPAPEVQAPGNPTQLLPSVERLAFSVPQPVSHRYLSSLPTASEVPPTAVTQAELAGVSTCFVPVLATSSPLSPEEK